MSQRPDVAGENHRGLGLVWQQRAGGLLDFFTGVGLVVGGEHRGPALLALQQLFGHRPVFGGGPVGPVLEQPVQVFVFLVLGTLDETEHSTANVALAYLREACSGPVPD